MKPLLFQSKSRDPWYREQIFDRFRCRKIGSMLYYNTKVNYAVAYGLYEESPSSTGQECRITSGRGNSKDSATERYRQ